MIKTFVSTHQLINLINNGAFELGDGTPFWAFSPGVNNYAITKNTSGGGSLIVDLFSDTPFVFSQEFGANKQGVFDFNVPLSAGTRASVAGGYNVKEAKVLPYGPYTLSALIKTDFGVVSVAPVIEDRRTEESGAAPDDLEFDGPASTVIARPGWILVVFKFRTTRRLSKIGWSIVRRQAQTHTKVEITKCSLVLGAYDQVVYTGDTLARVLPRGAIVLSLGASCPDGFSQLEEGTPPASWAAADPTIKLKRGNFPASVPAPTGNVKHTTNTQVTQETPGIALFDGFDSKLYIEQTALFESTRSSGKVDVPDQNGEATHEHSIEEAPAVPVSVNFVLCKRL